MWIVEDEVMDTLLGGDFTQVILVKQLSPEVNVKQLYNCQFNYFSYNGFRKFFNKYIYKIFNKVRYIENDSITGKVLSRGFLNEKKS